VGPNPYPGNRSPFDQTFHMILNLAIGGNFFPSNQYGEFVPERDILTWTSQYMVDYVRVYSEENTEISENLEQSDESNLGQAENTGNTDASQVEQPGNFQEFAKSWLALPSVFGLVAIVVVVIVAIILRRQSRAVTEEKIPLIKM